MYKNRADVVKNRLYVTFRGRIDIPEIKAGGLNVISEAKKLRSGFGIVSDISEFIPASEEGRLEMQSIMKQLKELGLGHVVRIVRQLNSISGGQWQRTFSGAGYKADEVTSLIEAEALLNMLEKFD